MTRRPDPNLPPGIGVITTTTKALLNIMRGLEDYNGVKRMKKVAESENA